MAVLDTESGRLAALEVVTAMGYDPHDVPRDGLTMEPRPSGVTIARVRRYARDENGRHMFSSLKEWATVEDRWLRRPGGEWQQVD